MGYIDDYIKCREENKGYVSGELAKEVQKELKDKLGDLEKKEKRIL